MVNGKMVKCNFLQEILKNFNCFMPCQAVFFVPFPLMEK